MTNVNVYIKLRVLSADKQHTTAHVYVCHQIGAAENSWYERISSIFVVCPFAP